MWWDIVIGLYKRKFLFFLSLFLLVVGIFSYLRGQFSEASLAEFVQPTSEGVYDLELEIKKNGQVFLNNKKIPHLIRAYKDHDEFRFIAFNEEGFFVNQLRVTVRLPQPVDPDLVKPNIYAVHGVGSYQYEFRDRQTLVYSGYKIFPKATFTLVAELSKGIISFPWYQKMISNLFNLPGSLWLGLSLALPFLTLIILSWMMMKSLKGWKLVLPREILPAPPSDLAPAVVGVLLEGRVSARLLAATLIDLARRGYLNIIQKDQEFIFVKKSSAGIFGPFTPGLKPFEKILLSKIFRPIGVKSTLRDIQVRIGRHVFSRKVAEIYLSLYEEVTARGFFYENPSRFHQRFYFVGLALFFVSLIGFLFGIFFAPEPKFLLLVWFGMILSALLVIKLAPRLPLWTPLGQKEAREWLKFKNFLVGQTSLTFQENQQEVFERYLPYALALGCEDQWAGLFFDLPFRTPDWFSSSRPVFIFEDFINNFFPIISYISQELSRSHEPIVE